jgi:hypothetical protein
MLCEAYEGEKKEEEEEENVEEEDDQCDVVLSFVFVCIVSEFFRVALLRFVCVCVCRENLGRDLCVIACTFELMRCLSNGDCEPPCAHCT